MPVQFSGIAPEHAAVRTTAGMFDISHMGNLPCKEKTDRATPRFSAVWFESFATRSSSVYGVIKSSSWIIDDIIVYNEGNGKVVVIVNAGTKDKDKEWLLGHLDLQKVEFQDLSADRALIAIQGPQAAAQLQSLVDVDLAIIPNFGHTRAQY